jgi:PAS domain S-box-containing protein
MSFDDITEANPDSVVALNADGTILDINAAGAALWELGSTVSARGKRFVDLWPFETQERILLAIQAAAQLPSLVEGFCVTPSGKRYWLETRLVPLKLSLGKPNRILCICRDFSDSRKAKESLLEEEVQDRARNALYREIIDSAIETAIIGTDTHGQIILWSEGAHQITGWTGEEMLGSPLATIFTPEDRAAGRPALEMRRAAETGRAADMRWHERKDGQRFFANGAINPILGPASGFVKSFRDATQQHLIETALKQSEERYASLFNSIDAGFCIIDIEFDRERRPVDYRFVEVNPAFATNTGLSAVVGKSIRELVPNIEQFWIETYAKVAATGESIRFENRAVALSNRWYEVYAFRSGDPGKNRVAILFTDISNRKRAEAELGLSEARLANALTIAALGTFDWNTRTDSIVLSDRAREILGFGPGGPIQAADLQARIHPEDYAQNYASGVAALQSGARRTAEYRVELPDGTERYVRSVSDVATDDAVPARLVGVVEDITEQHLARKSLQQLNETLEQRVNERTVELRQVEDALRQSQKMEAIGQLTGGIAHDFNNLLAGVIGSLELMQSKIKQGRLEELDRHVVAAQAASKRAAALTHRLLAFSRRQTLSPTVTDVNWLIKSMEDLIRRTIGPSLMLEVAETEELWKTPVDQNQLENALLNLCINARDAMPNGGRVTIETDNCVFNKREAAERDMQAGQYVSLSVTDTGVGMTPAILSRAFEPFFTTKPLGSGTGLGLSMTYGFARQSGGHLRMYSEVGRGTTVCIYLPRADDEAKVPPIEVKLPEARRAIPGETVLVIDDEELVRKLILEVLEDLGYSSLQAADGAAGLKILKSNTRIDLLVTDVGLPGGMNGRQLADAALSLRSDLKVLFITGYAENAVINHGHLEPGMQIMTKPFQMDALAIKIRGMIESPD